MHYQDIRGRIWQRRLLVSIPVLVVGVVLSQYVNLPPTEKIENLKPIVKSENVLPDPNSVELENWKRILQELDNQRALAISRRDESALEFIYAMDSPIAIADRQLIQSLIANNASVEKLNFVVQNVQKISHRWSGNEEVVELEVTDERSSYYLSQNGARKHVPTRAAETWLISLVKHPGGWLIGEVQPLLDDR